MKYLKLYEEMKSLSTMIPSEIYNGAIKDLRENGDFEDIDSLFGFYDYWLTVADPPNYDPIYIKDELDRDYSISPSRYEEWFPMYCSQDEEFIEYIMCELARLYFRSL